MTTAVGVYKEIQLDFEAANTLQQELTVLMRNNAPAAEIALKGNQMIQKKLSGITVAISQVDTLVDSIQKVKGLLDELISQTASSQSKLQNTRQSKATRRSAAKQLNNTYVTLKYLIDNTKDEYGKKELQSALQIAKSNLADIKYGHSALDHLYGLKGIKTVFGSLASKLMLEKSKLVAATRDLEQLKYTLIAVETEEKLAFTSESLAGVLGKIGSYSDRQNTRTLSLKLLNRQKNTQVIQRDDDQFYDQISAAIDADDY